MSAFLPKVAVIESVLMRKEALLSCMIDGIEVPPYSIFDVTEKNQARIRPVRNYISTMSHGLEKMVFSKYSNALLCEMHGKLIHSDMDKYSGQFRKEQVFLGKIVTVTNSEQYLPTAPLYLHSAMRDMENFLKRKDSFDAIIKAALAHYQLETIHPFMTGNGRIGRILSYLILSGMKVLTCPILCLSQYLYYNKLEYIDRMERLRRIYEYEQWIKFYIQAIIFAAADSIDRIKKWLVIRDATQEKIKDSGKSIKAIMKSLDAIELYPIVDANTLAEKSGISYNTAAATLKLLCDLKILKQSNKLERNRDYANVEFLRCFVGDIFSDEGGEYGYI
jgi:Fic family protein